jgi:hypothetical protein
VGNGLGTTIKYLRRTMSGAAGNGLGTTAKYLRGAAGIGLGTTIKYQIFTRPRFRPVGPPESHAEVFYHRRRRRNDC